MSKFWWKEKKKRLSNCGCLFVPEQCVGLESQRIKDSFRNSLKFSVSWKTLSLYFLFSWTQSMLKEKEIDLQCSEPVHPVTYRVQSLWSDHSSVYLCYFHLNQPSSPDLKSEAICPSTFKNTCKWIFGAKMNECSCFYKDTLQCVHSIQQKGRSAFNGKKQEDVLLLFSSACDKGTI